MNDFKNITDLDNTILNTDSDYEWNLFIIKFNFKKNFFFYKNSIFFNNYNNTKLNILLYLIFTTKITKNKIFCEFIKIKNFFYKKFIKIKITLNIINEIHNKIIYKNLNIINTSTNSIISKNLIKYIKFNNIVSSYIYNLVYKFNINNNNYCKGIINYKINKIINSEIYYNKIKKKLNKKLKFSTDSKNDIFLIKIINIKKITNPDKILFNISISKYWKIFIYKLSI